MQEELLLMSTREVKRLYVVQQVLDRKLRQKQAAQILGHSDRQLRRWMVRVKQEGPKGLIHRLRGRASNRKLPQALKVRVLKLCQERYQGFGPTLAQEKLLEREKIRVGRETIRRWLTEAKLWQRERKAAPAHRWRERRACAGELVQMDGSHHDWLEGRGSKLVLMAYIDDATSRVYARFYDYEGTLPAMDSFRRYVSCYGLPQSLYADRHTTYQSPGKAKLEDELEGRDRPQSQFERALSKLGVELIPAYSPQAKGRVERLFRTFQDRLIKELRLASTSTLADANRLLKRYLPRHNKRFSCRARSAVNLHRPNPGRGILDKALVIRQDRLLRQDQTIQYKGKRYLIAGSWQRRRPKQLQVEDRLNGKRFILDGEKTLRYREVQLQPKSNPAPKRAPSKRSACVIPASHHPWRNLILPTYRNRTILKSQEQDISIGR
jgi:transposase